MDPTVLQQTSQQQQKSEPPKANHISSFFHSSSAVKEESKVPKYQPSLQKSKTEVKNRVEESKSEEAQTPTLPLSDEEKDEPLLDAAKEVASSEPEVREEKPVADLPTLLDHFHDAISKVEPTLRGSILKKALAYPNMASKRSGSESVNFQNAGLFGDMRKHGIL